MMPVPSAMADTCADRHALLARIRCALGPVYESDVVASFLYSLVRLVRPAVVVELGRGLGVSALHMAVALNENAGGHLWTIDDERTPVDDVPLDNMLSRLAAHGVAGSVPPVRDLVDAFAAALGVRGEITQISATINLDTTRFLPPMPFDGESIDLLFSDFRHSAEALVRILGWAIPRMSRSSAIVFDSASTWWPSWLFLEKLVDMLSKGRVPALFGELGYDLGGRVGDCRYTLVHLPMPGKRQQNGPAWLKIEPHDLVPWPPTAMRSPDGKLLGW